AWWGAGGCRRTRPNAAGGAATARHGLDAARARVLHAPGLRVRGVGAHVHRARSPTRAAIQGAGSRAVALGIDPSGTLRDRPPRRHAGTRADAAGPALAIEGRSCVTLGGSSHSLTARANSFEWMEMAYGRLSQFNLSSPLPGSGREVRLSPAENRSRSMAHAPQQVGASPSDASRRLDCCTDAGLARRLPQRGCDAARCRRAHAVAPVGGTRGAIRRSRVSQARDAATRRRLQISRRLLVRFAALSRAACARTRRTVLWKSRTGRRARGKTVRRALDRRD